MAFWNRKENRADEPEGSVQFDTELLTAMLTGGRVTREMALAIPSVAGAIDIIANAVASTPVKLYREKDGKAEEVKGDNRVRLLNDETGDTLNSVEFWKAIVRDYFLGKGGYAYINKSGTGEFQSVHYVDEGYISIQKNADPIFKDYRIHVNGTAYEPHRFLKILRNTKDGMTGTPIMEDNRELIDVAYETLLFERSLVKRGGAKKGFLKSEKRLLQENLDKLKASFARMYSNSSENTVVLNQGLDFKEASATSVEMQLNENKKMNADEFARLFHIPSGVIAGKADDGDSSALAKLAVIPVMMAIQCALNRDFLREREKGEYYWAFDTKQLLKGSMKERFEAYKVALDSNFMQVDEVRYEEDMAPLGLTWIRLGLQDVLYDPVKKTVYTPNTGQTKALNENRLEGGEDDDGH